MSEDKEPLSPSRYMRARRPEIYSDSASRDTIDLARDVFEYRLQTVTSRNETGAFELFCRKLAERTLCPRLRPQTGPEGGGDSKVDTETYAAADELAELTYFADHTNGERWGFAFSAKEDWRAKAKSDVAKIVATARGYKRIIFITNQFAKSKDRAALEDALTAQHGVAVTIHDRTWIVERIIDDERKDIAFNYLAVGAEVKGKRQGPNDYSRAQQLEDIEELLKTPERYDGMEYQLAAEALVAAKLSRNLERPRHETSGRLQRAIQLADRHGSYRQKLETRYEDIWTAFWWFDDFQHVIDSYDGFAAMALPSNEARDLELAATLMQLFFTLVFRGEADKDEVGLNAKIDALTARLVDVAGDPERPNNALEAKTSLLLIRLNWAMAAQDGDETSRIWAEYSDVLDAAKPLGDFPARRLLHLIEAFGEITADPDYDALLEKTAEFIAERESEAQAGLVLLKRGRRLGLDNNVQMIRMLSRAARWLTKKEYADEQIEALQLLSVAYRSVGLPWAARGAAFVALASIVSESAENHDLRLDIIPTLEILGWVALELRHIPDFIDACQILNGIHQGHPLSAEMKEDVGDKRISLDMCLASTLLNASAAELERLSTAPNLLYAVGLPQSRNALMYALGHEATLREQGFVPETETPEAVAGLFDELARQPVSAHISGPLILNEEPIFNGETKVLGLTIAVTAPANDICIVVAEALLGTVEALMATTLDLDLAPHTERFEIDIVEGEADAPSFEIVDHGARGRFLWPQGRVLTDMTTLPENGRALYEAAGITLAYCFVARDMGDTFEKLWHEDNGLGERLAMIAPSSNSRQRVFGERVARISARPSEVLTQYELRAERPAINCNLHRQNPDPEERGHRSRKVRSVIDLHLWDAAKWQGAAYPRHPSLPPMIALMFKDETAACAIFERWRERFGADDANDDIYVAVVHHVDAANPSHYTMMVTSRVERSALVETEHLMVSTRTNTMTPETSENLDLFLAHFTKAGYFELMPAVQKNGDWQPLFDLGIKKRALSVMNADEVGREHIEFVALPRRVRDSKDKAAGFDRGPGKTSAR